MNRRVAIFALLAALLTVTPAIAGPNEDAAGVRAKWAQAFNEGNGDKLAALYTKDAMFWVSAAALRRGPDGVRAYLSNLPPGLTAEMGEQSAIAIEPNVVLSAGLVQFKTKDGKLVPYRLTLALVKVDGQWPIAQYHASPLPKS